MSQDVTKIQIAEIIARRFQAAFIWKYLWSLLLFIVGILLIGFIAAALISALSIGDFAMMYVTIGAAIADGAICAWIYKCRMDASDEEEKALEALKAISPKFREDSNPFDILKGQT